MHSTEKSVHSLLTEWQEHGQHNRDRLSLVKKYFPVVPVETQKAIVTAMGLYRRAQRLGTDSHQRIVFRDRKIAGG